MTLLAPSALVTGPGRSTEPAIRTQDLTKRYGRVVAVDHLGLDVRRGDRFGFLGPNGSGKTTTVRMLLGLVYATAGTAEVLGQAVPKHKQDVLPRIGALVEGPAFRGALSGRENLSIYDAAGPGSPRATRKARIETALERVGLAGVDKRPVRAYSLGMRQRLGIAAALLRGPELLILDEPTNGLDPQGIHEVRDLFAALNAEGTTVFLSSHLLSEVEALCDHVAIINGGRMIAQDSVAALRAPTGRVEVRTPDPTLAAHLLQRNDGEQHRLAARTGDHLMIDSWDPAGVNTLLVQGGVRVAELVVTRRTLENVFLDLTHGQSADRL